MPGTVNGALLEFSLGQKPEARWRGSPCPQMPVAMDTATLLSQPLAVIPVCWAAGLVACGCGRPATAGHGHFKVSFIWSCGLEGAGRGTCVPMDLNNSDLPKWGPWVGHGGSWEAPGAMTKIVKGPEHFPVRPRTFAEVWDPAPRHIGDEGSTFPTRKRRRVGRGKDPS